MTMQTKIGVGIGVVVLGVLFLRQRNANASALDELKKLKARLFAAEHPLLDPYDDGPDIGITVCRADGTGCVSGSGGGVFGD